MPMVASNKLDDLLSAGESPHQSALKALLSTLCFD